MFRPNRPAPRAAALLLALAAFAAAAQPEAGAGAAAPAAAVPPKPVSAGPGGVTQVRHLDIPPSALLSKEARALLPGMRPTEGPGSAAASTAPPPSGDMAALRRSMNEQLAPNVAHMRELYPVEVEETTIAGVPAAHVTPAGGVPAGNADKVLINLPGGGFRTGIRANGLLMSIPVASVGRYRVVTLTYRQAPEFRHPAALDDLTAVYRELLKTYKPENVGLFGCSAGGTLISQAVAGWQKAGLPVPAVLGIYCAGLALVDGDSAYFAYAGGGGVGAPVAGVVRAGSFAYYEGLDVSQPALSPANDLELLRRFPPTIFMTGTRDFWMSSAAYSHRRLLKVGVASELLIYDGLGHGFMTNPDLPESRDGYELAAAFYRRHLGRR